MTNTTSRIRKEDGQTFVEFAFVLPILLAVVFAIVEFGIAFNNHLALTDAVRAGSRQGAVSRLLPNPAGVAEQRVRDAAGGSLDPTNPNFIVTVTFRDVGGGSAIEQGGNITVRATYPYEIDIFGIPIKTGTLISETTERVE